MVYFYEILKNRIGYSRIGRIVLSKKSKKYVSTPNILLPMRNFLMKNLNYLEEFKDHEIFLITKEVFLKIGFLRDKFKDTAFVFTHTGTLQNFVEIIKNNISIFLEDNITLLIPFNIPTTSINNEFSQNEIVNYIDTVKDLLANYPKINFGLSIQVFENPEFIELYKPLIKEFNNIKLLNLIDILDSNTNYRIALDLINYIKQNFDNNLVLMASGRIIPKFFPILVYLGFDLIDTSYLLFLSSENYYDTVEYLLPIYKINHFPCSCIACRTKLSALHMLKYSSEKIDSLCLHNLINAKTYMLKVKQYLKTEDFRAFVEKSSYDDILIVSILKILDRKKYNLLKYETPLLASISTTKCFGPSSYYRPDFQQFRERVIKYFTPEKGTKLIIIFPCSAKKPYSDSKSHKKFQSILRKFPDFPDFQEIILTSPLGAIPRQLENIYPANSYDISVTGLWDSEEINLASQMLFNILRKYKKEIPIICHTNEKGYKEIVLKAKEKLPHQFHFTQIEKSPTDFKSLKSLEDHVNSFKDFLTSKEKVQKKRIHSKTWIRKFIKITDYQFSNKIGEKLFYNGIKIKRNRLNRDIEIFDLKDKKKLAKFVFETGQIEPTIHGAKIISESNKKSNTIVFDGESIKGSTLFRPGVKKFSSDLIPGNVVIILDNNKKKVIGVAKLIMGSHYIKNSKSGRVAKIYEKIE